MHKAHRFCNHPGCNNFATQYGYCDRHIEDYYIKMERTKAAANKRADKRRGTARQRGYTYRWDKYSRAFLARPENKFCKLHLDDGCNILAQCVDHIEPPSSANDPLFWDASNHQAACIHCNSVKGHRKIIGTYEYGDIDTNGTG